MTEGSPREGFCPLSHADGLQTQMTTIKSLDFTPRVLRMFLISEYNHSNPFIIAGLRGLFTFTCATRQNELLDNRHSGGSGGRGVEAAAVRAVGCVWASVGHLRAVGVAVQTPPLIRYGERKEM